MIRPKIRTISILLLSKRLLAGCACARAQLTTLDVKMPSMNTQVSNVISIGLLVGRNQANSGMLSHSNLLNSANGGLKPTVKTMNGIESRENWSNGDLRSHKTA